MLDKSIYPALSLALADVVTDKFLWRRLAAILIFATADKNLGVYRAATIRDSISAATDLVNAMLKADRVSMEKEVDLEKEDGPKKPKASTKKSKKKV